jgi:hypothetical protein
MFRRLAANLPPDAKVPQTLDEFGYFINENGQVCSKTNPEEFFNYKVSKNQRYNEMRRSAMHNIVRDEVAKRMESLNMQQLYLPQMATQQPKDEQFLPIYVSSLDELKYKSRILVVVPGQLSEFGTWSYRDMFDETGIEFGSAVSLARILAERGRSSPGLIILNPNETYYSHQLNRPFTLQGWQDRPRPSSLHPMPVVDNKWNRVPGNASAEEHVQFVFEKILLSKKYVQSDCKIDIIGMMEGGRMAMAYLDRNCK